MAVGLAHGYHRVAKDPEGGPTLLGVDGILACLSWEASLPTEGEGARTQVPPCGQVRRDVWRCEEYDVGRHLLWGAHQGVGGTSEYEGGASEYERAA